MSAPSWRGRQISAAGATKSGCSSPSLSPHAVTSGRPGPPFEAAAGPTLRLPVSDFSFDCEGTFSEVFAGLELAFVMPGEVNPLSACSQFLSSEPDKRPEASQIW